MAVQEAQALYAMYTTLMNRLLCHGDAAATAEFFGWLTCHR